MANAQQNNRPRFLYDGYWPASPAVLYPLAVDSSRQGLVNLDKSKRHGVYFLPLPSSLPNRRVNASNLSSSRSHSGHSSSSCNSTYYHTRTVTTGIPVLSTASSADSDEEDEDEEVYSVDLRSLEREPNSSRIQVLNRNLKYDDMRVYAVREARIQALRMMMHGGLGMEDMIPCTRPGCRNILNGVRSLMFHVHIHNVHEKSNRCDKCHRRFECKRELATHTCYSRMKELTKRCISYFKLKIGST